ncbi:Holliday junction resolvase RecU [Paenalkalicoccus suaedae]|uniref:Holliday junction resolvase RecU n=1 Tax=Paenalkalicoccus suaedae TaxID=2592382 RepID=A0A859FEX4_9BACI|nr:Holliday junction resolvase RecU [Paenalkalicoccus suaedae]QKS71134.1 Holliday junction resolvase RecU [Paenalkalicoccus suaedae]
MSINYPNGKKFTKKRIPEGKKNVYKKDDSFGNRGMSFEDDINETNDYYLAHEFAVIHKKPTPLQIVNVHYPKRSAAVVTEAYFQKPSTTDYNGLYNGYYIDFEAKETKNKTSFPLKNFHDHQLTHMERVVKHSGIAFILLHFAYHGEVYFLPAEYLLRFCETMERKSIPKVEIEEHGILVKTGYMPRIDYLKAVDTYLATRNK